jgi:ATP-dependent DNA helicase RecQ
VKSTGERFGAAHVADVLAGKTNEKAEALRHTSFPSSASARRMAATHWQSLLRQMVGGGFLSIDVAGFGGLGITPKGRALMNGEVEFRYRADVSAPSKKAERAQGA